MQVPPEVSYRDVEKTEATEKLIRDKIAKLEQLHPDIISCRVSVEKPQTYQESGSPYRVRILVRTPPGHELVARRGSTNGEMHETLETVVRDAFESMRSQLRSLAGKQKGEEKKHPEQQLNGIVARIFPEQNYGFLRVVDGSTVYFHRNSVLNADFDRLEVGTGIHCETEMGDKGLQATTVRIVDKPGH